MRMPQCETCGNHDAKAFAVVVGDAAYVFDSFECAIRALAPRCGGCGRVIVGRGVQAGGGRFCGADCAGHHRGRSPATT
jgi:hypothetical protein